MEPEPPELMQSALRHAGFTVSEFESDEGVVAVAERGPQRVTATAPSAAEAWQAVWVRLWFGPDGYPPRD